MNQDDVTTRIPLLSSEDPVSPPPPFTVGQWVSVASRTSPGINQPGGIGRITSLSDNNDHVSVKYVLDGRHEKNVHVQYVQKYTWEEETTTETAASSNNANNTRLRDRTMLLGRCTYCGSLRADCRSCDLAVSSWNNIDSNHSTYVTVPEVRRPKHTSRRHAIPAPSSLLQTNTENDTETSSSGSDSSKDVEYERMMQRHRREYLRYKRSVRRAAAWNDEDARRSVTKPSEGSNGSRPLQRKSPKKIRRRNNHHLQNEISILATVGAASESECDQSTQDGHPVVDLASNSDGNSDTDHSLDHLPLQQLAARALQRPVTQCHPSFIQPEGDAEQLPQDVPDLTDAVTYPQLLPLLDELLQKMEAVDIPQAKHDLLQFERAFQEAQKDPQVMRAQLHTFQQQSKSMHDTMVQSIIRNGYDQCQIALRKLTSRRFYKQYVQSQQADELPIAFLGNEVDVRELKLDALGQAAEEILSHLRRYSSILKLHGEDEDDASVEYLSASDHASQYSSTSDPFHQQLLASQAVLPPRPLQEPFPNILDLHPHARRKKRQQSGRDRRRVEPRHRRKKEVRRKGQTVDGDQRIDVDPGDFDDDVNVDALSMDPTLSDGAQSVDSASSSSFFLQQLRASQSPSQPPPLSLVDFPRHRNEQRSRYDQRNLESRHRIGSTRARAFQSVKETNGRRRNFVEEPKPHYRNASDNFDIDPNRTGICSRAQVDTGKEKAIEFLLQERSNATRKADRARQLDTMGNDEVQKKKSRVTASSEEIHLTVNDIPNDENQPRKSYAADDSFMTSNISNVPEIEALLPSSPLSTDGMKLSDRHQRSKRSKIDRMEEWLGANAVNSLTSNPSDSDASLDRTRNVRHNESRKPPTSAMISPNTIRSIQSNLFSTLGKDGSSPISTTDVIEPDIPDLSDYCRSMVRLQSNELLSKSLNDLCAWFENGNGASRSDVHFCFQSMVDLLLNNDLVTLQFLVSKESLNIGRFISIIVALLRLLRCKANDWLLAIDNGLVFDIFSKDRCKTFVDFVVLQFVDTVLSIFHPQAWDLRICNMHYVLDQLKPLRDELWRHFDLVERACQILSAELGPQEWRCVLGGEGIYVSSINPDDWRSFLSRGALPPKPTAIRFSSFGDVYPRCEVDAIWCLVGFLAGSNISNNDSDDIRWHFLSQVLSKGSLTVSHDPDRHAPPEDQIEAAVEDLTNLTTLIASGALGSLPRRDTILVDLFQRCVELECDFVEANGISWAPVMSNPSDKREELITKVLSLFEQPTSNASTEGSRARDSFLSFLRDLSAPDIETSVMNKPLLLPSSRLLRCGLALLLAWKRQIPSQKVKRLQCFEHVIKALIKSLTSENSASVDNAHCSFSAKRDAFLDAFSSPPSDESITESRRLLVRTEIAAYITLFSLFGFNSDRELVLGLMHHSDVISTCDLLWSIVSDDAMRQRRDWLSSRENLCKPTQKFNGDINRLYCASKVLSLVGVLIAGCHPFRIDAIFPSQLAEGDRVVETTRSAASCVAFVLSTLMTCLDCICDMKYTPEVLSSIVICLLLVLRVFDLVSSIRTTHESPVVSIASPNSDDVRSVLHFFAQSQSLLRVFKNVLISEGSGFEADMSFQSVILALRYVLKFSLDKARVASASPRPDATSAVVTDDDFGEIDDAVLANLDLSNLSIESKGDDHGMEWIHSIFNALADALLCSKPSVRNYIHPCHSTGSDIAVSIQGMRLVQDHAELICSILAEVATMRWHPLCSMRALWKVGNRFSFFDDSDDVMYLKVLGMRISRQICRSYDSANVHSMMKDEGESFLFNMLESIIAHKVLRRIPSCNLDRIRLNGGSRAEEQGFAELFEFRNGYPKRLKSKLQETRSFCHDVCQALFAVSESIDSASTVSSFKQHLLVFSSEVHPVELVPSLERELLDRFVLFQGLLIDASAHALDVSSFERLSVLLMTSCSYELIYLLLRIGIQDQAYSDLKQEDYGCSKLFETVACLSELLVGLITETIRCHSCSLSTSSQDFKALLRHICDSFVSPLFAGQPLRLMTVLREMVSYGSSFLRGTKPNFSRIASMASPNFDTKRYCDLLRNSFICRSREFIVAIAASTVCEPNWKSSKLLNAILVAGISSNIDVSVFIAQCLCRTVFYTAHLHPMEASSPPMKQGIDQVYAQMEKDSLLLNSQTKSLHTVSCFALRDFAVPRLLKPGSDARSKILLLRFTQCILDHDPKGRIPNVSCDSPDVLLDVLTLCSVARGIGMSIWTSLDLNMVDEPLVLASYSCARSLMGVSVSCVYPNAVGWLVDWAYPSPDETSNTIHSNYLWYFCCWMRELGGLLLDAQANSILQTLRDASKAAEPVPFWPSLGPNDGSVSISRHLNVLEQQIFPASDSTGDVMKLNRYNKSTSTARPVERNIATEDNVGGVPVGDWQPSKDVRSVVHQFIEKVKFATPTR